MPLVMEKPKKRWFVLLSEPKRGKVHLAVDFQQPLPSQEAKNHTLPLIAADGVIYQSGLVAVEGCAEFNVQVNTKDRKVDVGELVDADYQPGRRLLGVYGFAGLPPAVIINVARNPSYTIYPALVQKAMLSTHLSPDGESHTEASFTLCTKALYLELQIPAGSELWSAEIDGSPIKPQREKKSILIGLPAVAGSTLHTLKVVYRTPTESLGFRGNVELAGPKLLLCADRETKAVEVPLADLEWKLCLPNGYEVVRSTGTVTTDELDRPSPAAMVIAGSIYKKSGEVGKYGLLPAITSVARKASKSCSVKTADYVNREYGRSEGVPMAKAPVAPCVPPAGGEFKTEAAPPPKTAADVIKEVLADEESKNAAEEKQQLNVTGGITTLRNSSKSHGEADDLKKMMESLGTAETETLNIKQRNILDEAAIGRQTDFDNARQPEGAANLEIHKYSSMDLSKPNEVPEIAVAPPSPVPPGYPPAPKSAPLPSGKLTGVNSLKISLENTPEFDGRVMTFQSLGRDPVLRVELADRQRFEMLGWAVAFFAFLIGAAMTRRSTRTKIRYVIFLAVVATLVPAVWDCIATAWVCNLLFYAASWLVLYYLLAGIAPGYATASAAERQNISSTTQPGRQPCCFSVWESRY